MLKNSDSSAINEHRWWLAYDPFCLLINPIFVQGTLGTI